MGWLDDSWLTMRALRHHYQQTYFWFYLVAIILVELITTYVQPVIGLGCHSVLLCALFFSIARSEGKTAHLLIALTLPPLIRILSLVLPLAQIDQIYWYFVISVPLFAATFVAVRLTQVSWVELGLRLSWRESVVQIGVALSGLAFGWVAFQILRPRPLVDEFSLAAIWLPALILLLSTGFLEELIFRGLLQHLARCVLGEGIGLVYVSSLFAALYIGHRSLTGVVLMFMAGLFFAWVVARTKSIWGVTLAHGLANMAMFLLFPFA